jgi:hypothetical protein
MEVNGQLWKSDGPIARPEESYRVCVCIGQIWAAASQKIKVFRF